MAKRKLTKAPAVDLDHWHLQPSKQLDCLELSNLTRGRYFLDGLHIISNSNFVYPWAIELHRFTSPVDGQEYPAGIIYLTETAKNEILQAFKELSNA